MLGGPFPGRTRCLLRGGKARTWILSRARKRFNLLLSHYLCLLRGEAGGEDLMRWRGVLVQTKALVGARAVVMLTSIINRPNWVIRVNPQGPQEHRLLVHDFKHLAD